MVVAAPGRVNLIGEHTDYSLLPVLPMAIDRAVTVAAAVDPGRTEVWSDREPEPASGEGWGAYVTAALEGFDRGLLATVASDLPPAGGLSSSSALTMALVGAMAMLSSGALDPDDVVGRAVAAERLTGVESGAMDQTVIAFGRRGHALRIDFTFDGGSTRTYLPVPGGMRFVAAYSGTTAHKRGSARLAYNSAVVACRLATVLLAARLGGQARLPVLAEVARLEGMSAAIDALPERTSAGAVAGDLGVDPTALVALAASSFDPEAPVAVRDAAAHVISEAQRVDLTEAALRRQDLGRLGQLLDDSHASLRRFGASTPGLDRVTAAMRSAGATGARLTGAGFGGFALAACPPGAVESVIKAAVRATGGPAFEVRASDGIGRLQDA